MACANAVFQRSHSCARGVVDLFMWTLIRSSRAGTEAALKDPGFMRALFEALPGVDPDQVLFRFASMGFRTRVPAGGNS